MSEKTVWGKVYETTPELNKGSCHGCVGDVDNALCQQLRKCALDRVIWIEKEEPVANITDAGGLEAMTAARRTSVPVVAGRKDDGGKLDVTLFFNDLPHAIESVTEVLQWAITKKQPVPYERGSWQFVPDFQRRYQGASLRHELNRVKGKISGAASGIDGEPLDAETGLMELAHIATDAMFRLEMAVRKFKGLPVPEGA